MTFDTILVANRGEIARRIMRTARAMGFGTVAVCSEADRRAAFVREADTAVVIGPAPSRDSYLRIDRIVDAALRTGAGAIHPGYGFLSENEAFARACGDAGLVFIGPTPEAIAAMGSKIAAKRLMAAHGVPVVPGFDGGGLPDVGDAAFVAAAPAIGLPLLVKASAGGGGKGMRIVKHLDDLPAALAAARREAETAFGDPTLLVERYVEGPRHIEVQILGDAHGNVVHCFERECSIQRRHQKILEEAPSPGLDPARRAAIGEAAVRAGRAIGYRSAGTVEFVMGADGQFYFLEVNTRLQVEHPVTEMVTGLDLVRLQIEVALGKPLPFRQEDLRISGHAIEARLYAEDADHDFLPQIGTLLDFEVPAAEGIRLDSGVERGDEVGIHYDPMLAKLVAFGATREEANRRLGRALAGASVLGVTTNIPFLRAVVAHPAWRAGALSTHFIADHREALAGRHLDPVLAARLATVAATTRTDEARTILPDLPLGWRNNRFVDPLTSWTAREAGPAGATHTLHCRHRALGGGRFLTRVGESDEGVEVTVLSHDAIVWRFEVAGRVLGARIVEADERLFVHVDGAELRLDRVPRFQSSAAARDQGSCKAPMPGKIMALRVEVGATVEAGQPLVVMEAMKMEHTLEAPAAGVVAEILVAVGEVVQADAELVRLEPA
ncbi:MAG: ATP-grasp domain-containing protein [Deltaproteobacteria bacterium]|nr:ATP-grasp domain-containing protein [Deltaproteobacteria bacterium]